MLRLTIILFILVGASGICHSAGIYDDSLISTDGKKDKLDTKTNRPQFLNSNPEETSSEYHTTLLSILKENTIKQLIQEKPLGNIKSYLPGTNGNDFAQTISNEEIDAQALLETVVVWTEIKQDLNYINDISNTINTWTSQLFDGNMDENIDSNMVLTTNILTITHPTDKPNLLKSINTLSNIYQGDTKNKYQNEYKITSSYNYAANNFYEKQNNSEKIDSEKSLFSIVYLWNTYSDIIIITIGVLIILIAISGLIKFLSK